MRPPRATTRVAPGSPLPIPLEFVHDAEMGGPHDGRVEAARDAVPDRPPPEAPGHASGVGSNCSSVNSMTASAPACIAARQAPERGRIDSV